MAAAVVLLNGSATAAIPPDDRGLAYGDGLFETIAVDASGPRFFSLHLQRLLGGCERLGIVLDRDLLVAEVRRLLPVAATGVLKIIITRAASGRGYGAPRGSTGQRLLQFQPQPLPPLRRDGLRLRLCRQRLAEQPALAGLKHLNRLEQVLARSEWQDPAIDEGLMLDQQERLVEATAANIFLLVGGELVTPRLHRCGVAGVMRRIVMERLAPALGLTVREGDLPLPVLYRAQELFITSALRGVAPVAEVDDLRLPGCGVTIALQTQLELLCPNETPL
jgi:4-amino-4-deoxychorismate lyase